MPFHIVFYTFATMKNYFWLLAVSASLCGCAETQDEKAAPLMAQIEALYEAGNYAQTLDSIMALRKDYPEAVESRKAALKIWQDASLKMAQADIAKTDSSLQVTLHALEGKRPLFERNMLHVKCDSLKARYEAMCGVVKMIRYRQQHP